MKTRTLIVLFLLFCLPVLAAEIGPVMPSEIANEPLSAILKFAQPASKEIRADLGDLETRAKSLKESGFDASAKQISDQIRLQRINEKGFLSFGAKDVLKYLNERAAIYDKFNKDVFKERSDGGVLTISDSMFVTGTVTGTVWASNGTIFGIPAPTYKKEKIEPEQIRSDRTKDDMQFVWREVEVSQYEAIPPAEVTAALKKVKDLGLFDYYTVAKVDFEKAQLKDPLLLGRIEGSDQRYFIAQWDNDVDIRDLLRAKAGKVFQRTSK